MAGSYKHLVGGGGLSLIENMGDAAECIEELFFLVRAHLSAEEIETALEHFYRMERGEAEWAMVAGRYPKAYRETKAMMES